MKKRTESWRRGIEDMKLVRSRLAHFNASAQPFIQIFEGGNKASKSVSIWIQPVAHIHNQKKIPFWTSQDSVGLIL